MTGVPFKTNACIFQNKIIIIIAGVTSTVEEEHSYASNTASEWDYLQRHSEESHAVDAVMILV